MKKLFFSSLFFLTLIGCKENNNLVEVAIPEPEEINTNSIFKEPSEFKANGKFQLLAIPYAFDDLEPAIDGRTMELHYGKHYLNYTNKLNEIVAEKKWENLSITQLLESVDEINIDFKNNAGGYYNHTVFFESLTPKKDLKPSDELLNALKADFGSFDTFISEFKKASNSIFGSGWTWLIVDKEGKLQITTTQNQDNPLMFTNEVKGKPILCLDVWEHAYYLKYQNNRKKYIDAYFEIINWELVSEKYSSTVTTNPQL